jgi:hypothetical protein
MRQKHKRARTGADLWAALHADYASWMATDAPLLQKQLEQLGLRPGEGIRASFHRAGVPPLDMADVERPLDHNFMVGKVLAGLLKDRPAWQPMLLGPWCSMHGQETLEELTGGLADTESRSRELTPTTAPPRAHASTPAPLGADARLASMKAQLQEITLALRKGTVPPPRPQHEERPGRQGRHCFCCDSEQHVARDCPKKYSSHSALPSHHLGDCWLLDPGTSHHISPGGRVGTHPFTNCQPFQQPLMVHFSKRRAVTPALWMASLVICGCCAFVAAVLGP